MKPMIIALGLAALVACSKQERPEQSHEPATPRKVARHKPKPTPERKEAAPEIAEATPIPNRYAPDGVYYLRVAQRVNTEHGIIGIKRGTEVSQQRNGTFKTLDGDIIELSSSQVTNDLDEVQLILKQENISEAALTNWRAQNARAEHANNRVLAATPEVRERVIVIRERPYAPTPEPRNPLERRAYDEKRGVSRSPTYRWIY